MMRVALKLWDFYEILKLFKVPPILEIAPEILFEEEIKGLGVGSRYDDAPVFNFRSRQILKFHMGGKSPGHGNVDSGL